MHTQKRFNFMEIMELRANKSKARALNRKVQTIYALNWLISQLRYRRKSLKIESQGQI